jgi:hypothetical protein
MCTVPQYEPHRHLDLEERIVQLFANPCCTEPRYARLVTRTRDYCSTSRLFNGILEGFGLLRSRLRRSIATLSNCVHVAGLFLVPW